MKRSEILKAIALVIKHNDLSCTCCGPTDIEQTSKDVLDIIEKVGMLPPTGVFHATGDYELVKNVIDYAELDFSPKWDPEDNEDAAE